MKNFPIETPRLILRRFRAHDLDDLYAYLSDPEVVRFEPYPPMDLREVEETLKQRIDSEEMIAVALKSTDKLIGNLYFGKRDFESAEIGFVFHRSYWGQGFATESAKALIEAAFSAGLHRIYAECDPKNTNSWRLLERLGFRREAHFRQNIYFTTDAMGDPLWKDTFVYAILNENEP